jgi:hypothetical protein
MRLNLNDCNAYIVFNTAAHRGLQGDGMKAVSANDGMER